MSTSEDKSASAKKLQWSKDPNLCWISTFGQIVSCSAITRMDLNTPISETELEVWQFITDETQVVNAASTEYDNMRLVHDTMSATKLFNDIRWEKHGLSTGKGSDFFINNDHIPLLARILNELKQVPFLTSRKIEGERLMSIGPYTLAEARMTIDRTKYIEENIEQFVQTWNENDAIGMVIDSRTMTYDEAHRVLLTKLAEHYSK